MEENSLEIEREQILQNSFTMMVSLQLEELFDVFFLKREVGEEALKCRKIMPKMREERKRGRSPPLKKKIFIWSFQTLLCISLLYKSSSFFWIEHLKK